MTDENELPPVEELTEEYNRQFEGHPSQMFEGLDPDQQRELDRGLRIFGRKFREQILDERQKEFEAFQAANFKEGVDPNKFWRAQSELDVLQREPMTPANMKRRAELTELLNDASRSKNRPSQDSYHYGPLSKDRSDE
jgi:hypothetical protein